MKRGVGMEASSEANDDRPSERPFTGKELWDAARSVIEHEDGLIDNRLRWMFTLVGFLFAGIAITVNAEVNLMSQQTDINPRTFSDMVLVLRTFRISAALIGIIAALATIDGLIAAELSILKAASGYRAVAASSEPLPFSPIGGPGSEFFKLSPGLWFCITLLGMWVSFLTWTAGSPGSVAVVCGVASGIVASVLTWRRIKPMVRSFFDREVDR